VLSDNKDVSKDKNNNKMINELFEEAMKNPIINKKIVKIANDKKIVLQQKN